MQLRHILVFVLLNGATGSLVAQVLPLRAFTVREGLPANNVRSLLQDSRGFLWVGTANGLARYDGVQFDVFNTVNGLTNNFITVLRESPRDPGSIWIGTINGGVCRYRQGAITTVLPGRDIQERNISDLWEDDRGRLWCGTAHGLGRIEGDTVRYIVRGRSGLRFAAAGGLLFVAFENGVFSIRGDTLASVRGLDDGDVNPTVLVADGPGSLWIGTKDGSVIHWVDSAIVSRVRLSEPVWSLSFEDKHTLWAMGNTLLTRIPITDTSSVVTYGPSEGVSATFSGPVFVDRESNVWFGSWFNGLWKLPREKYFSIQTATGKESSYNGFAVSNRMDRFWLATIKGTMEVFPGRGGRWTLHHQTSIDHIAGVDNIPYVMDSRSRLWVLSGKRDAIYRFDVSSGYREPSVLRHAGRLSLGQSSDIPYSPFFAMDPSGQLWISLNERIMIFNPDKMRTSQILTTDDVPRLASTRAFCWDHNGDAWLGDFSHGLTKLRFLDGKWKAAQTFTTEEGLPDNGIRSLAEDKQGRLWIGTRYGGVAVFDGTGIQTIGLKEGLRSASAWGLYIHENKRVYVATDVGLESIDPVTFQIVPEPLITAGTTGITVGALRDSMLWLLTPASLELQLLTSGDLPLPVPPVYVTRFNVEGQDRDFRSPLELAFNTNSILIQYIGVSFREAGQLQYLYKVDGLDREWRGPTTERALTLAGLRPGEYTFRVRPVVPPDSTASEASVSFTIIPAFWERWWFIGLAALAAVLLPGAMVRRRLSALQKAKQVQEEFSRSLIASQEQERKRIAAELHDSLGQNLLIIKNKAEMGAAQPTDAPAHLQEISDIASRSVAEVREIAHDLRPYLLDKLGLTKGLRSMIRRLGDSSGITFVEQIAEIDGFFSPDQEINFYRIIQEATNNVVKHSRGSECMVCVERTGRILTAAISDNGIGVGPPHERNGETGGGFGLVGISERVRLLGGVWSIERRPEGGTQLRVEIPHGARRKT